MLNKMRDVQDQAFFGYDEENEDTQANKFLSFKLKKESYCVSIKNVIEIVELQKISEVPDMPEFMKGVINLRGKIIPVIDLRLRFKIEPRVYDDRTCIIISEIESRQIGFIVDNVEEVVEIPENKIDPSPSFNSKDKRNSFIKGLGRFNENVKIILDTQKILVGGELESITEQVEKV